MKKLYPLLSVLFLIYWGCNEPRFMYDSNYDYGQTDNCETVTGDTINLWGVDYSVDCTTELDLSNSGLTGEIPPEIGNLINLSYLNLEDNQLTGSIPPEIWNLTKLDGLFNYFNLFGPNEKGGLFLSNNQLSGVIPDSICNFNFIFGYSMSPFFPPTPINFSISNNKFCPPYSSCIEDYLLGYQDMCSCGFDDDDVVDLWGKCYSIEYTTVINLPDSGLTGEIPPEIGNLTNLTSLRLESNQLTGEIPESICNLTNLTWSSISYSPHTYSTITFNQLCPPYPSCIEDNVGTQDTSDCP